MVEYETASDKHEKEESRNVIAWKKFSDKLATINVASYLEEENPDILIEALLRDIREMRESVTRKIRVSRYSTPIQPWISKSILVLMKDRDRYWQKLRDDPDDPFLILFFQKNSIGNSEMECEEN